MKSTKRTGIVALFAVAALAACGGPDHPVPNPSGTWTLTDTLKEGTCAPTATATISVNQNGNSISMSEGGQQYAIDSSWCDTNVCEVRGTLNGARRDVEFNSDGSLAGNRSTPACLYMTAGHR